MSRLNTVEASELLGVAYATLATWRTQGKGPGWEKIKGRVLYDKAEVERWENHRDLAAKLRLVRWEKIDSQLLAEIFRMIASDTPEALGA